jgi:DNA-binding NarL/FixJ family response regulator
MNTAARCAQQSAVVPGRVKANPVWDGRAEHGLGERGNPARLYLAAENRLLLDALSKTLAKRHDLEVVGAASATSFDPEVLRAQQVDMLLLTSRGDLKEDLELINTVRRAAPDVRILMLGQAETEIEFLQYVRAGIKGYLLRDASAEDVLEAIKAAQQGHAVCPGSLCASLFRYLEGESSAFPSAAVHQRLGLTRREQQLIPLVSQGLTNKEIANHFCLSEQTVKNHLYRMKQKVGAHDRLGIVQVCRRQGFML